MGESPIFKESIENTALYGGWLWNQYEGSHFAYHNSPGLFIFVPLVWMFGKYRSRRFFQKTFKQIQSLRKELQSV